MACDLFRRCVSQQHDDDWSEFTRLYGPRFRSLVLQTLVRNEVPAPYQEVEDCMQELFLRLLALDAHSFRGRDELQLWRYLARIVDNLVTDRRRGRNRTRLRERRRAVSSTPAPGPSPESHAMVREHLHGFLRCCRRAAGGLRVELKMRIVRLAFFDGLSSREIARTLCGQLSPGQVDTMIYHLRQGLARQGVEVARRRPTTAMLAP